ncbi:hypothetical protein OG625_40395 (plasmid) [Streptomyces sp. NBC_01351]|uniref:hypothetical protein n=1 Tax=Streptomyces sp. NBC_01351 TaxID=2903833 RepID=UPI002E2ED93A|nr:hypothetical protein [Streptomyces sp. NBC_01351]
MDRVFIRRPKRLAAVSGLVIAVGLAVVPAQADSKPSYERPATTGSIGQSAAPGGLVTRDQVIARAKHWVDKAVPYSQTSWWKDDATGGRYRQDCSGFVSMAWQLKDSLTTQSLPSVADRLSGFDQLEAGDALDYPATHTVLFGGWSNKAKGDFVYYSESRSGRPARKDTANIHDSRIAGHPRTAYIPLRYKKITTTPRTPGPAPTQPTAPAKPAPTATAVPSPPATATSPPKPKAKPKPSSTTAASPQPSTTAPAASVPPSASTPRADTAGGPTTAARPDATVPMPSGGCAPTVRISFWQWIFSF